MTKIIEVLFILFLSSRSLCQHTGAYSSPQYAKKLYPLKPSYQTNTLLPLKNPAIPFKTDPWKVNNQNSYENHQADDSNLDENQRYSNNKETNQSNKKWINENSNKRSDQATSKIEEYELNDDERVDNKTSTYGRSSFLSSATSFLTESGGKIMAEMAKDFIARSTGSSQVGFECLTQVLSLNLTNLVILILLKALILGAGFFGAGAWKGGHGYGRSIDDDNYAEIFTQDELALLLGYIASGNEDYGCLNLVSCKKPRKAAMYASAADLLTHAARLANGNGTSIQRYDKIVEGMMKAVEWGHTGMPCDQKFRCTTNSRKKKK